MRLLGQVRLLFLRKVLEALRQPAWLVMGLITPLLYLVLFAPILNKLAGGPGFGHSTVLDVFLPGLLSLLAFGSGMGAGWTVIFELDSGVIERLRVTPVSRFALVMGTVLRDVIAYLIPAVTVVVVAIPFGYHPHPGGLVILLVLTGLLTATVSAWSAALGIVLRQIGSLAAVVTGLQLPLTLLSGVLLPLSLAPAWLRDLGHVDPLYYTVEASRRLSAGHIANGTVALGFLITAGLAAVTVLWATRIYRTAVI
jgi:ABC-2 type transport system permease protein